MSSGGTNGRMPPELRGAAVLVFAFVVTFLIGYMLGSATYAATWCAP